MEYKKKIFSIPFMNDRKPIKIVAWNMRDAIERISSVEKNLAYAILRGAVLKSTNMAGLNLHRADFEGSDLRGVDFYNTDLSNANLRYTDLRFTSFYKTDLRGADLRYTHWQAKNAEERNAVFIEARMLKTKLPLDANEDLLKKKIFAIEREMNAAMALPDPCLVSEQKFLKLTTMKLIQKMDDEELMNWICEIRNACLKEFRKGVAQPQCWLEWLQSDNPDRVDRSDECKD